MRDGRTLALADGRVLRLAAIEVTAQARAALAALAAGRTLRLATLGPDHDRYGRLVAFAFAGDAKQSLQQMLLEAGAGARRAAGRRQGLRGRAAGGRAGGPRGPPRACGPIPISPLCRPKVPPASQANGAISRWWKARSCRCTQAAAQYI